MKRRDFIKKAGLTATASVVLPYILPSGRLFAATGSRSVNHVVFCLFGGGVRNLESVHKIDGNLMPYTLNGNESISSDIAPGMTNLPASTGTRLQDEGTLFREFRYATGPTGHYNGHTTAMTGRYAETNIALREPPPFPTIFEYYRKHNSPLNSALNAWWVSDSLGPYPFLNFSNYPGYGPLYAANMIQPASFFNIQTKEVLDHPLDFHYNDGVHANNLRSFFDNQFASQVDGTVTNVENTAEDADRINTYFKNILAEAEAGQLNDPWGIGGFNMNNDMVNLLHAGKILEEFAPELMVVNMQGIDVCHANFTEYCNNIRKADFALSKLWEKIQSIPEMANDTVMIVAPEHGRNEDPNTLVDAYGRFALDHTNDNMSREIFCLVAGPSNVVNQGQLITQVTGESIDVVPTIANLLGFDTEIPSGMLPGRVLSEAFV